MVYVAAFIIMWFAFPSFQARLRDLRWTFSHVAFLTGTGLWLWLLARVVRVSVQDVMAMLVVADLLAMASTSVYQGLNYLVPTPLALGFVIVPAMAHLLVEPIRRWKQRLVR